MSRPAFEGMTGEELDAKITVILDAREAEEKPLTIEYLAYELGVDKHTLARYRKHDPGEHQGDHAYNAHCAAVKKGYLRCELWLADQLHSGRPVGAIFALKCGHSWQETPQRHEIAGGFFMPVDTSAADDDDA